MIDLHFSPTPVAQKITIALEELQLPYTIINYDIFEGDQNTPEFGKINLNHKLPAIVDHDPPFGGASHTVFETGAILQYLAEKTGRLLPSDPRERSNAIQWLTWQVAGLSPMGGQASHFARYARERIEYAIDRYTREVKRLLHVLERRLGEVEYLAGSEYSIADICVYPGWASAGLLKLEAAEFTNIARWADTVGARPGVQRGMAAELALPPKYRQVKATLSDDEWSNMFGDKMHEAIKL